MPRMIDLMRQSAVPEHIMRSASLGSLSLPPGEMIEILVFLTKNPVFGKQARMTLAGWDETTSIAVANDPNTPGEVLQYLTAPQNRRPKLVPALLENQAVPEATLLEVAQADSRELVEMMLASTRVRQSANVLHALASNPHLTATEAQQIQAALAATTSESTGTAIQEGKRPTSAETGQMCGTSESGVTPYEVEHAAEIAAEEGRPFELVDSTIDEHTEMKAVAAVAAAAPATVSKQPAAGERLTILQKIARLTVGERVQLAMRGSKDERLILIRDGSKIVSHAVLESPKVGDQEVESFAAMKNVHESVLRDISMKRRFMKNYAVVRALANNPRCPLDISLTMVKNLLVNDLKNLSVNKNVPDTLRKVASKLFNEKKTGGKKAE